MTASDNNDCLYDAGKMTAVSAGLGLVISAMQNTVQKHTEGAKGVFTRTGSTIGLFAAVGGIFTATECASKSIRGEDDAINAGIAGCAAGFVAGVKTGSIAKMCAACAGVGATMFAYEYSGELKGALNGKSVSERKDVRDSFFKTTTNAEADA
ncbi:Tim17/Tim22/Tim23/Pmp24 family-domain-containing protein [Syncephalastrum racemosum]|uniref:Tim17/Tim22/Tim23/Pmp24 family-domain-containing protein n=1 Tax=Syncephalastrum racemosum TaxID=13706 RepID=A0A1X2H824_SYNRA|nr:Tim17/Tim22/Tim23/Pmp24 family-domain-containing protein [Syncephalastrum racemosum]